MRIRNLKCTKVKKAQKVRINYELRSSFQEFSNLISERNDSEEIQAGFNTNHIIVSHINHWIQHEIIKPIIIFYFILKCKSKVLIIPKFSHYTTNIIRKLLRIIYSFFVQKLDSSFFSFMKIEILYFKINSNFYHSHVNLNHNHRIKWNSKSMLNE